MRADKYRFWLNVSMGTLAISLTVIFLAHLLKANGYPLLSNILLGFFISSGGMWFSYHIVQMLGGKP